MNAALFPLVYYLRVLVVVDIISLAAHYPIDEALAAIHRLRGRVHGVEVFGLCRYIDMTW
jgi:hypothetical protein